MIWMMRNAWKGDHTTKETPPSFRTVFWVFMSPSTLTDKRRMKETRRKFYVTAQWRDHLNWAQPSWSHQCFFKTLVVGPAGVWPRDDPRPPSRHTDALPTQLTGRHEVAEQARSIFSPWNLPHFRPVCNSIVGYSLSQSYRDGTRSPKTNIPIYFSNYRHVVFVWLDFDAKMARITCLWPDGADRLPNELVFRSYTLVIWVEPVI